MIYFDIETDFILSSEASVYTQFFYTTLVFNFLFRRFVLVSVLFENHPSIVLKLGTIAFFVINIVVSWKGNEVVCLGFLMEVLLFDVPVLASQGFFSLGLRPVLMTASAFHQVLVLV